MAEKENQLLDDEDLLQVHGGSVTFPESLQGGKIIMRRPTGITSQEQFSKEVDTDAEKIFQKYYQPGNPSSIKQTMSQVLNNMSYGSLGDTYYLDPVKRRVMDKFMEQMKEK